MQYLASYLPGIEIVLGVILIAGVLLQHSEAGLGSAFGGDSTTGGFHTKRGFERVLFFGTIIVGILFVFSTILALVLQG